jgi:vacuolar protein sorting-associated protein 35
VNIKQIVIALIDRLAAYAAREAESEDPEETKRQEEAAARRLADKVKLQKARVRENGSATTVSPNADSHGAWGSPPQSPGAEPQKHAPERGLNGTSTAPDGDEKDKPPIAKKFRGIPEDVQLFEVFWKQVVELIKVCQATHSFVAFAKPMSVGSARSIDTGYHCPTRIIDEPVIKLLS